MDFALLVSNFEVKHQLLLAHIVNCDFRILSIIMLFIFMLRIFSIFTLNYYANVKFVMSWSMWHAIQYFLFKFHFLLKDHCFIFLVN